MYVGDVVKSIRASMVVSETEEKKEERKEQPADQKEGSQDGKENSKKRKTSAVKWPLVLNMGGAARVSRLDMGLILARVMKLDGSSMVGIKVADAGLAGKRPADLSMDITRLTHTLGIKMLGFEDGVQDCFTQL